jgi:GT2 family glycosyltransferase
MASRHTRAAQTGPGGPDSALPSVTILIPVLNDAAGLTRCLASIRANDYPISRLAIIVADNGSVDGSADAALDGGAAVVRLPGVSVAAARNHIAALAESDVLAFVDADHELSDTWIRSAVSALAKPQVGAAGAPYHPPRNATWVQRLYDAFRSHPGAPSETRWLGSGNLAIWRRAFQDINGFDTSLVACEDVDFCQRLRDRGYRLVADGRMRSIHYGDPATLRALFACELWRGRDNLTVSFRTRPSLRDMPSVLIPVGILASLCSIPAALVAAAIGTPRPLVAALAITAVAPAARALTMVQRQGDWHPFRYAQAFAVASTYDVARALALVIRKSHRRAR